MNQSNEIQRVERIPRPGDELEVLIERLNADGDGECKVWAEYMGKMRSYTVRVRHALPGDRWRVRVKGRKSGDLNITRLAMIEGATQRITPYCKHFGEPDNDQRGCGGCTLQHMSYEDQLSWKAQQVRTQFAANRLDQAPLKPIIGHNPPWGYRNKMEFSFGTDSQGRYALGLHPARFRHDVVRLDTCEIFAPWVGLLLSRLRGWFEASGFIPYDGKKGTGFLRSLTLREGKKTGERMLDLLTAGDLETPYRGALVESAVAVDELMAFAVAQAQEIGAPLASAYWTQQITQKGSPTRIEERLCWGQPAIHEVLALPGGRSLRFEIHPRAFFQPNPSQAEQLYGLVVKGLLDGDPPKTATALDLYCGTGTIGLCLAPFVAKVVGVEMSPQAVLGARRNAAYNDLQNVTFFAGDVAQVLETEAFREAVGDQPDWVVVDPPRAGLTLQARGIVRALGAERIAYVSCNPETLARDLAFLTKDAAYEVRSVQPIDMFPHTKHVECVVMLRKCI